MAETESKSPADPSPVAPRSAADVIVASAKEAFGSALVLWLLGGVALGIAGAFAGNMIPSPPPGFEGQYSWKSHHHGGWHMFHQRAFVIFFAIFFIHSLWVGFHARPGGRIPRILSNLRKNWFGLIIGNAIGAWVAVLILGLLPNISLWRMLWHWVWGMILPILGGIAHFVFGDAAADGVGNWLSWFDANRLKLTFWIIFLGGAFDDLGVPNYKTLARWLWRRMQKRKEMTLSATVERTDLA